MINPESLAYNPDAEEKKKRRLPKFLRLKGPGKRTTIILSSVAAGILLTGGGWYGYQHLFKPQSPVANPAANDAPPQAVLGLVESVGRHVSGIPNNEVPSVATVTDVAKLRDQIFFENAQKGDKVLIYAGARKAYLYRPSTDKIIEESSVELADDPAKQDSTASNSAEASTSAKPALRIKF